MKFFYCLIIACLIPVVSIQSQTFSMKSPPPGTVQISTGAATTASIGTAVEATNVDINNIEDFAISAPGSDSVYLIYRSTSIPTKINLGQLFTNGTTVRGKEGSQFGYSLATVGDMNKDGYGEIAIGAPADGEGGRVYVLRGGQYVFNPIDVTFDLDKVLFIVEGAAGEQLGALLGDGGDFNNDAFADLFIPSPKRTGGGGGYLIYGRMQYTEAVLRTSALDPQTSLTVTAPSAAGETGVGSLFQLAGDLTNDGARDAVFYTGLNSSGSGSGGVAIIPGGKKLTGTIDYSQITGVSTLAFQLFPEAEMNQITALDSGALDQDNRVDLVVGFAKGNAQGEAAQTGALAVVPGTSLTGGAVTITRTSPIVLIGHKDTGSGLGSALAVQDGLLAAGAPQASDPAQPSSKPGAAYLLNLKEVTAPQVFPDISQTAYATFVGRDDQDRFGSAVDITLQSRGLYLLASAVGDQDAASVPVYMIPSMPLEGPTPTPTLTPSRTPTEGPETTPTPFPEGTPTVAMTPTPAATPAATFTPTTTSTPPVTVDVNGDGVLDSRDLFSFMADWGKSTNGTTLPSDIVPDAAGKIDALDLLRLIRIYQSTHQP